MNPFFRIILTFGLTLCMNAIQAQPAGNNLNNIWELNSAEPLSGMGGIGEEMKLLDMRSKTQLLFGGEAGSETISYKVIDQEIQLFNKKGRRIGQDIIWKIEHLAAEELIILLIAGEDKEKLARLKYRVKK